MALTGYQNRCAKNSGGVRSIRLIEVDKIVDVQYDAQSDAYSGFTLENSATFAEYQFREDQAAYRETVSLQSGSVKVSHELAFVIDRADGASRSAVEQIIEASWDGMVAVVGCNNGESFVVGYSQLFLKERPLRLLNSTAMSGVRLTDRTSQTVNLYCEDTQKAKCYIGSI